jgi:hypothetical protein
VVPTVSEKQPFVYEAWPAPLLLDALGKLSQKLGPFTFFPMLVAVKLDT